MGNLCSTPSVRDPVGHDHIGRYAAPMNIGMQPGTNYGYGAPYGVQSRQTGALAPGEQVRPSAPQQGVSTPTTTTTTTTTTTRDDPAMGDQLEVALNAPAGPQQLVVPIQEEVPLDDNADFSLQHKTQFNWTKGKLIGAGAFGRVFQGLDNDTGQIMAVKQVALTKDESLKGRVTEHIRALEAEVAVLLQLNHINIVRYLGTERSEDTLNIFLEYVPGGSIASLIEKFGPLQESVIRKYTQQILKGLEYLHQKKIMHRDIKGANILVDGTGTVKLADFGASKKIEDLATMASGSKSIRGTPYWMAPEVIKQTGHGRPADIWSLGCVVIEMATGKPPWSQCNTQVAAMFHIASTKEPPPLPDCLSSEARDFLLLCFNRVPKERPNATRLLRHPWMANIPPNPNSASTSMAGMSASAASTSTARHPLVPKLPLQSMLSPPSPIKEEETPHCVATQSAASAQPQLTASAQRALPPPPPSVGMGPLEHGRRSLMPQTTASLAMSVGLPPRPPQGSSSSAAGAAHPRVMPPLGQPPEEQYDTIVSPSSIPAELLAANAAANMAATGTAVPELQSCEASDVHSDSSAVDLACVSHPTIRQSTMTLSGFNPMEEPSWMPTAANASIRTALTAISEQASGPAPDAAPPPRKTPRDQADTPTVAAAAPLTLDVSEQMDQPNMEPSIDQARVSKMQEWRDQLFAELSSKRQAMRSTQALGQGTLSAAAIGVAAGVDPDA